MISDVYRCSATRKYRDFLEPGTVKQLEHALVVKKYNELTH